MSERRNNVPPKKPKKVNTVKSKSPSSNKFKKLVGWRDENGRIYADASKIKVLHSENKIDYVERNPNSDFEAFPDTELEPTLPAPELPPRPEAPKRNGKLIAGIIVGASLMVLVSIALIFILPRILNSGSAKQNTNITTGNTFTTSTSETTTAGTTQTTVSETVYTDLSAGDDDTSSFNGQKYQIIEGRMTWTEAEAYCEGKGGHLATITSKEEQEYILNLNSSKL